MPAKPLILAPWQLRAAREQMSADKVYIKMLGNRFREREADVKELVGLVKAMPWVKGDGMCLQCGKFKPDHAENFIVGMVQKALAKVEAHGEK